MFWLPFLIWLAVLPSRAGAEMYVGGYAGYVRSATVFRDYLVLTTHHPSLGTYEEHQTRGTFLKGVIGGGKIGLWFTPDGILGYPYPEWMKYFGVYLDCSYHQQDFRYREGNSVIPSAVINTRHSFRSDGDVITLALMFAGRYGFLPTEQVPAGRLQPYLAVGPALMITTQNVTLKSQAFDGAAFIPYTIAPGAETTVVPALAVEPGLKWMVHKNIGLDFSFKFRWAHPSFTFNYTDPISGTRESVTLHPQYLILSFQMGAAYHF